MSASPTDGPPQRELVVCVRCRGNKHRFYEGMSVTEAVVQIATGAEGLTLRVDICDRCNGSGVEL